MKRRARVYRTYNNGSLCLDFNRCKPVLIPEREGWDGDRPSEFSPGATKYVTGCVRGLRRVLRTIPLPRRNEVGQQAPDLREIDVTVLEVGSPEHERQERVDHLLDKIDKADTDKQLLGYARQLQQVRRG